MEASKMWVCKLVMFIQILREINGLQQRKELKSGCAAAHPAHAVLPPLISASLLFGRPKFDFWTSLRACIFADMIW